MSLDNKVPAVCRNGHYLRIYAGYYYVSRGDMAKLGAAPYVCRCGSNYFGR